MGSITCTECNHSFDAPLHLTEAAMALHKRTLHTQNPPPCEHDWGPTVFYGQPAAEVWCRRCGRSKLVVSYAAESWR